MASTEARRRRASRVCACGALLLPVRGGSTRELDGTGLLVAIDTSGRWWRSDSFEDVEEYVKAFSRQSYPIAHYRPCRCSCGSREFLLERDADDQARRTCRECGTLHYIADSEECWEPPVRKWKCVECKTTHCNVGVGFAGYENAATGIKWIYVGVRCPKCGCFADWKVALSDALNLLDKA